MNLKIHTLLASLLLTGCQSTEVAHGDIGGLPQNQFQPISFDKIYETLLREPQISEQVVQKYISSYKTLDKPYRTYFDAGLPVEEIKESAKNKVLEIQRTPGSNLQVFSLLNIGDYSQELGGFLLFKEDSNTIVHSSGIWVIEHNKSYYSSCTSRGHCGLEHSDGYYEARVSVDLKDWFIPMSIEQAKNMLDEIGTKDKKLPMLIVFQPRACVAGQSDKYRHSSYSDDQLITCKSDVKEVHLYSSSMLSSSDVPINTLKKVSG